MLNQESSHHSLHNNFHNFKEFHWNYLSLLLNILGSVIKKRISVDTIFVSAAVLNMFVNSYSCMSLVAW